jgi:uncharacterized protein with ACT and thioredoxin-like domain
MALSAADRRKAAVWYCGIVFREATAIYDLDQVINNIAAVDNALDITFNQAVSAGFGSSTIISGLGNQLVAPISSGTVSEKFLIGVAVFMARGGLL